MLLYRVCTEGRFAAYLWGPHGLAGAGTAVLYGPQISRFVDWPFGTLARTYLTVFLLGLAATGLVLGIQTRLSAFTAITILWLTMLRLPALADGGDNITMLVLTYMIACISPDERVASGSIRIWIHNIGVLFIITQLLIMYFATGMYKAGGDLWQNGTALYVIGQVEIFSLPSLRGAFLNPFVLVLATYGTVIYQVWFPLAMFNRFLKIPWLIGGMLFHLGIATFMGLVAFSTVMIGLDLFMITDDEYEAIFSRFHSAISAIKQRLSRDGVQAVDMTLGTGQSEA
jgi:hypothetical protein